MDRLLLADRCCNELAMAGYAPADASVIVDHLLQSTVAGHESHGVEVLPLVLDASATSSQWIEVSERGPVAVVRGNRASGYLTGHRALQECLERARTRGVAVIAIANDQPTLGCLGNYGLAAARESFAFFAAAISPPAVGMGQIARFGTNPLCVAAPRRGESPLIIDFACSAVSWGKASLALARSGELPDDWGRVIDDDIVLNPAGGFKGLLLAASIELLVSSLLDNPAVQPTERWSGVFVALATSTMGGFEAVVEDVIERLEAESPTGRSPGAGRAGDAPPEIPVSLHLADLLGFVSDDAGESS